MKIEYEVLEALEVLINDSIRLTITDNFPFCASTKIQLLMEILSALICQHYFP